MAFQPIEIEDSVFAFDAGLNAGQAPILLQKNQLWSVRNSTLRGLFLLPRPPYQTITLNYNGDSGVQAAVETGLWQGATYYHPDIGAESLLASISGRLFQFIVVGNVATVVERTGGNAQLSTAPQCWLWQSEKWVIWNDGVSLPVFFDGAITRRSLGPAIQIGTVANQFTNPGVGVAVAITLSTTYTGPLNVPIRVGDLLFQVASSGTVADSYQIVVKLLWGTGGNGSSESAGTNLVLKPSYIGYVTQNIPSFSYANFGVDKVIPMSDTTGLPPVGTTISIHTPANNTYSARIVSSTASDVTLHFSSPFNTTANITTNSLVYDPANVQPNVVAGTLSTGFTVSANGQTATAKLTSAFAGNVGAIIYGSTIPNIDCQYRVESITYVGPSATINAIQLTSTANATTAATTPVFTVGELSAGRMGAYGLGRNWFALPDGRSYMAGDIVGGSAGTPAYNYRDAVLKITENGYLAGGGVFVVPGAVGDIRSMRFVAELDKSLGQGPLQVGTPTVVFSCNAPIDRSVWQNVTNPIQTQSLIGFGPLGQYSTILWNGDMMFRSRDGWRSLILAKREFQTWGNVPISDELGALVPADDVSLLPFASSIIFDNRFIGTMGPVSTPQGVYFDKMAIINADPISSLRGKAQSIWEGIWDGLNVLQVVVGQFRETDRAFAFHLNLDAGRIELHELLPSGPDHFDDGNVAIVQEYELPVLSFASKGRDANTLIRLIDGECYCDSLDGATKFEVFFKPDYDTEYHPWYSWTVPVGATWQPRMGLGEPPSESDPLTERPWREGYRFQFKVRVTGYARFYGARFRAVTIPQQKMAPQFPPTE